MLDVKDVDTASLSILNDEQRIQKATEVKVLANQAFKGGKLDEALALYKEAANYMSKLRRALYQILYVRHNCRLYINTSLTLTNLTEVSWNNSIFFVDTVKVRERLLKS